MSNAKVIPISAFAVTVVAVVSSLVAVAGDWLKIVLTISGEFLIMTATLWKFCGTDPFLGKVCQDIPKEAVTSDLEATRATAILGLVAVSVSACLLAKQAFHVPNLQIGYTAIGLNTLAGLFLMIGMTTFTEFTKGPLVDESGLTLYEYGFTLAICGWLVAWLAIPLIWASNSDDTNPTTAAAS